jgi:hypothetical protein
MAMTDKDRNTSDGRPGRTAGAFDIRMMIAALIGIYGVVLVLTALLGTSDAELRRAGGMNINLLAGIGMTVVAALFGLWARLRPVVVAEESEDTAEDRSEAELAGGA